jgi:hypothetical protein
VVFPSIDSLPNIPNVIEWEKRTASARINLRKLRLFRFAEKDCSIVESPMSDLWGWIPAWAVVSEGGLPSRDMSSSGPSERGDPVHASISDIPSGTNSKG